MPKVVDHVERRKQIARALWAVVARRGFEAASARAIAAEGGWSLGALRHYFDSQDELVEFAAWELIDGAGTRVETIYATMPPGRTRCLRALEQLLPLDEIREGLVLPERERERWLTDLKQRDFIETEQDRERWLEGLKSRGHVDSDQAARPDRIDFTMDLVRSWLINRADRELRDLIDQWRAS